MPQSKEEFSMTMDGTTPNIMEVRDKVMAEIRDVIARNGLTKLKIDWSK